jgi:hypothetical protein
MSGKLKILPHKRWNVWGQENQETVLRDEREAREAAAGRRATERRIDQEATYERLTGVAAGLGTAGHIELVSSLAGQSTACDERRREEDRVLQQRRRDGTAPWELGAGSVEKAALKPWYLKDKYGTISEKCRSISRVHKEEDLKLSMDPMTGYIKPPPSTSVLDGYATHSRKRDRSPSRLDIDELRQRRIGRERSEKKRAAILLAGIDINGEASGSRSALAGKYSQQFNPHLLHR